MDTKEVEEFSSRLSRELEVLNWHERNDLLIRIGRQELRMRSDGQDRPVWKGPAPVGSILGADVVVPTEQGERRGRVICFGVVNMGSEYEKSVVVHVPASGTHHEAAGSYARLASPEDSLRIKNEIEMVTRLNEAAYAAAQAPSDPDEALKRHRKRGLRDPKLIEEFLELARNSPNVRSLDEGSVNHKITGSDSSKKMYVFKTQLRVDLSGFSFDHHALRKISDDEARDMHLGKVRGQIIFDDREQALAAFKVALEMMK